LDQASRTAKGISKANASIEEVARPKALAKPTKGWKKEIDRGPKYKEEKFSEHKLGQHLRDHEWYTGDQ
jgi:hypothetical protein